MTDFANALAMAADPQILPWDAFYERRSLVIRAGLDLAGLTGVEIGPLADPLIRKSDGDVLYADHVDTEQLRQKYSVVAGFDVSRILPVDIVLNGRPLSHSVGSKKFDYIIASHVVEHVPDLVGYLQDMRNCLADRGQLRIVLPDCRYSFDALRDETRMSDILTNWFTKAHRPGIRDIIDSELHCAPKVDGWGIYEGRAVAGDASPLHDFAAAISFAERNADSAHYRDVHCWVFRPRGFAKLMMGLARYGLVPLRCEFISNTTWPMLEFYVVMSPCDDAGQASASWEGAMCGLAEHPPGSVAARRMEAVQHMEEEIIALRSEIAAIRNSRTWRVLTKLRQLF